MNFWAMVVPEELVLWMWYETYLMYKMEQRKLMQAAVDAVAAETSSDAESSPALPAGGISEAETKPFANSEFATYSQQDVACT